MFIVILLLEVNANEFLPEKLLRIYYVCVEMLVFVCTWFMVTATEITGQQVKGEKGRKNGSKCHLVNFDLFDEGAKWQLARKAYFRFQISTRRMCRISFNCSFSLIGTHFIDSYKDDHVIVWLNVHLLELEVSASADIQIDILSMNSIAINFVTNKSVDKAICINAVGAEMGLDIGSEYTRQLSNRKNKLINEFLCEEKHTKEKPLQIIMAA